MASLDKALVEITPELESAWNEGEGTQTGISTWSLLLSAGYAFMVKPFGSPET
jgi:hypothetical protein